MGSLFFFETPGGVFFFDVFFVTPVRRVATHRLHTSSVVNPRTGPPRRQDGASVALREMPTVATRVATQLARLHRFQPPASPTSMTAAAAAAAAPPHPSEPASPAAPAGGGAGDESGSGGSLWPQLRGWLKQVRHHHKEEE